MARLMEENQLLSPLEEAILKTVLYFDIFSFPPKYEEVYRFLPQNSTSATHVREACQSLLFRSILSQQGEFVQLASRPNFVEQRLEREQRAERELRRARLVARGLRHVPFVRGIFLSGELSKGLASLRSDIDFVIVTAQGRLWLVRSILTVLKRLIFFGSKRFLCLNYFVSERNLEHEERNRFTAMEIATLKPLVGLALFDKYVQANRWVVDFLPNSTPNSIASLEHEPSSTLQRWSEHILNLISSTRFDPWLMNLWKWIWRRRYRELSDQQREQQFRSLPHLSTAYGSDLMRRILDAYESRVLEYHPGGE
jgi:hypothetical protein